MTDCDRIEEARGILEEMRIRIAVLGGYIANNQILTPIFTPVISAAQTYLSTYETEINQLEQNCEYIGKIDCDAMYLARVGVSEGDPMLVNNTAAAAIILQQINRRASGTRDFYSFSSVSDYLQGLGYTNVTQEGKGEGELSAYEGYMRYCQDHHPEALSGGWNPDPRFSNALVISRAMLWGQEKYSDPLAAFGEYADEYWNQVYSLYPEYKENETYRDYSAVLERLGLNLEQLRYVRDHPELIQEVSFDATVLNVLEEWKRLAIEELISRGQCDVQVPIPNQPEETISLCEFIQRYSYFPMILTWNGIISYGSTYTKLLPVANTSPGVYFSGSARAVLLYDDVPKSPIHTAWQCEQDPTDLDSRGRPRVNYRIGGANGPCRKCDPARLVVGSFTPEGYVKEEYCCDESNRDSCFCRGCTDDPNVTRCDECP